MEERFRLYLADKHSFNLATFHDEIEESFANVPDLQLYDNLADQIIGEEEEDEEVVDDPEPELGWDMDLYD